MDQERLQSGYLSVYAPQAKYASIGSNLYSSDEWN